MTNLAQESRFDDFPEYILPRVSMNEPNQAIILHAGNFEVGAAGDRTSIVGTIIFEWLPVTVVRFSGLVTASKSEISLGTNTDLVVDGIVIGIARLSRRRQEQGKLWIEGLSHEVVLGDRSVFVEKVSFVIPNIRNYRGDIVQISQSSGERMFEGRIHLKSSRYEVVINRLANYSAKKVILESKGGYLILACGSVTPVKGSLQMSKVLEFMKIISQFLYFLNGRRVDASFLTGIHEDKEVWRHFASYKTDTYKYVGSWVNQVDPIDFQSMWTTFLALWEDKSDRDFLETAIHWYVEANSNSAYLEGSIIFAQTALELIYNWLLVEKRKLILGDDADRISAANKIRLLLSHLGVSPAIPASCKFLSVGNDGTDAPEILVIIRNALVHGQEKKRLSLMKISPDAKIEALQIGLWYIELSLLYILGHKNTYYNRLSNKVEDAPWISKSS